MLQEKDRQVLSRLGQQLAEIAATPQMDKTRQMWIAKNARRPVRPLVLVDEIPWHEMDVDGQLKTEVEDPFWRQIEANMRQTLYKNQYIPSDMVVDPWINIPRAISSSGFGLVIDQDIAVTDPNNVIVGHAYRQQLKDEADIAKLVEPQLYEDEAETGRRQEEAEKIFSGVLDVHMQGMNWYFTLWDTLVEWMGPEQMLIDIVDRPEFLHMAIDKLVYVNERIVLQAETKGFADNKNRRAHSSYTYNDFLDEAKPGERSLLKNCWCHGAAQLFGSISPDMHDELEFQYVGKIYQHFGGVNYGCCEPLHNRIHLVRKLPNVRKISCSPWCDMEIAAENIGRDYVVSNKPAPAFVGGVSVDWDQIEADLRHTKEACFRNDTPLEYILKDISTVRYEPQRLWEWGKRAMRIAQE